MRLASVWRWLRVTKAEIIKLADDIERLIIERVGVENLERVVRTLSNRHIQPELGLDIKK